MDSKALAIAYVAPGWPLSDCPNGIVSYVENIITGLDQKVTKSLVLANSMSPDYKDEWAIDLSLFSGNRLVDRLADGVLYRTSLPDAICQTISRRIVSALKQFKMQMDLLEMEESFGASGLVKNKVSIPVVTRLHGPWFIIGEQLGVTKDKAFWRRVALEKMAIVKSSAVSSPSLAVLEKVREFYGIKLPDAQVIPNPAPVVNDQSKRWRLSDCEQKIVLFVGRFDSVKGGDLMIKAFRILAQQDKDVLLQFVGPDRGIVNNGIAVSLINYINNNVPEKDIRERIKILGTRCATEIQEMRLSALVTVVASRYENFPMTLLEALQLGCPVVATAVGGIPEIVTDRFNGVLVGHASAEEIAAKVLLLIDNPTLMETLSQNAVEDCTKRFHPRVVAGQTLDFYKSVIVNQA